MSASTRELRLRLLAGAALGAQSLSLSCDGSPLPTLRADKDCVWFALPRLTPGPHQLSARWLSLGGKERRHTWTQVVVARTSSPEPLRIVHFDGDSKTLYEGDRCKLEVEAPIGTTVQARFTDGTWFELAEGPPGSYKASHQVAKGECAPTGPLEVRCTLPDGRQLQTRSAHSVRLLGNLFTIRLDEPHNGDRVNWNFVIRGRTQPGARVRISPQLGGAAPSSAVLGDNPTRVGSLPQNLGTLETTADAQGRFEHTFGFPVHVFDVRYHFCVTAHSEDGLDAVPYTFSVVLGEPKIPQKDVRPPEVR